MDSSLLWIGFIVFILAMLALDLGVFNRKTHVVKIKEAVLWSVVWISLALLFNAGIWLYMGQQKAFEFLTGYVIEKSLSVDNIFVFVLIFSYFRIPAEYQHKILFWGVFGALVLRAVFIFAGVALIDKFHWIIYVFGAFLIYTGIKMITEKDKKFEPEHNPVMKIARKYFNVASNYNGSRFFIKEGGKKLVTPLFLVLLFIETTDVIFAVDSIPAILAVSNDTFIIFTSNVFAILGLRALYFALAGVIDKFRYLTYGLAIVLSFVGVKMLISGFYKIPILISLGFILLVIMASVLLSYIKIKEEEETA
jgi:tellurite resistance protein TerC